jgi:signal transduction histidine kinase
VKDNGAGIPASRIDAVFHPLESDPEREGTGLGLAIVKTFVEAHHGTVTVESVEAPGPSSASPCRARRLPKPRRKRPRSAPPQWNAS